MQNVVTLEQLKQGLHRQNVPSYPDELKKIFSLSFQKREVVNRRNVYEKRREIQWNELTSDRFAAGTLLGFALSGFLFRKELPYLAGAIGAALPIYALGGGIRMVLCRLYAERASKEAADLDSKIEQEFSQLKGPIDLCLEQATPSLKEEEPPTILEEVEPYVKVATEIFALVNFAGACFELVGYRKMGKLLSATRLFGVLSIVVSTAVSGLYDTSLSQRDRAARALVAAALLSILTCTAYQKITGVEFGEYQFAWMVISRGEYYGYLIVREGKAIATLFNAWRHSSRLKGESDAADQLKAVASLIGVNSTTDLPKKHQAAAQYIETLAKIRESRVAAARGLIELIRPFLRLLDLIPIHGGVYRMLRMAEGVSGLFAIWAYRSRSTYIERETVKYIRDRIDRFGFFNFQEQLDAMRDDKKLYKSDQELAKAHLDALEVRSFGEIAGQMKRWPARPKDGEDGS